MSQEIAQQHSRPLTPAEQKFAMVQRKAKVLASSSVVPERFQNNIANCIIAMEMAERMSAGDLEVMQNLYVVYGNPSFSASYLIAQVNRSGIIKGRLKFKFVGEPGKDAYGCFAYATERETGEMLEGSTVTIKVAKDEGWWGKKGSKWPTMTDQMLMYRAASFWTRVYGGDATMGMHTREEMEDVYERDITPANDEPSRVSSLSLSNSEPRGGIEDNVDTDTGEIIEQQTSNKVAHTPQEQSPAFTTLLERLKKTESEDDARTLIDTPIARKMNASEMASLQTEIEIHVGDLKDASENWSL